MTRTDEAQPVTELLAIEGGGTHSRGWHMRLDGTTWRELHRAVQGPANVQRVGPVGLARVLGNLREALCPGANWPRVVALGLAGVASAADEAAVLEALAAAGFAGSALVASDAQAALRGAVGRTPGILVIAGTGSITMGWSAQSGWVRAGGWGPILGDEGSALDLVRRAMDEVCRALDGACRDGPGEGGGGRILGRMMERLGVSSREAMIDWLRWASSAFTAQAVAGLADLAPAVIAAAQDGDALARSCIDEAVEDLAAQCETVARRLGTALVPVAIHGGLATGSEPYRQALEEALAAHGLTHVVVVEPDAAARGLIDLTTEPGARLAQVAAPAGDTRLTERTNPKAVDLDLRTPQEIVDLMLDEDALIPVAMRACREELARAVAAIVKSFETRGEGAHRGAERGGRGRLIYVGAGTSGRLGVLDASECPPTFSTEPEQVVGIIAGGDHALRHASEGAEDDPDGGRRAMDAVGVTDQDVVVGISASGRTPYVGGALDRAARQGATTVLVSCNPSPELAPMAGIVIAPAVGPEIVQGSTRLKAGTATKQVLNILSTASLALSGKVYSNRMVDLRPGSEKLLDRATRILCDLLNLDEGAARALFEAAGRRVKVALVMERLHLSREDAEKTLQNAGGFLRRALVDPTASSADPPAAKERTS